jgi:hypothetical protein
MRTKRPPQLQGRLQELQAAERAAASHRFAAQIAELAEIGGARSPALSSRDYRTVKARLLNTMRSIRGPAPRRPDNDDGGSDLPPAA